MFTTNSSFNTTQNTITESLNFLNYFNKEDLILLHKNTKVRIFRTEDRATELNLLNSSNLSELLKEYNIGILTNNKLIIIDFDEINEDVEELVESANTLTVKTKKGYHLYYYKKSDSINLLTQKKIKFRINDTIVCDIITGENNYVVAPGSTVVEGNKANPAIQELHTYFILKNLPILNFGDDTLTKDILNKLTNTTANMRPNIIERYPDRIIVNFHKIEEGHRNQTIVEIAGTLLHYFDTDEVIKFIQIYNQKCFEPPLPYSEVQVYVEGLAKRHRYKSVVKYDFAEDDKGLIFIKRNRRQQQQQQSEKIDPMILAKEIFSDYYYCEATDEFLKIEPITNTLQKV
ncbi:MAG: bifunctional DNA primase/polymerase, partial [Candidatus Anstonellaceae archaeon]